MHDLRPWLCFCALRSIWNARKSAWETLNGYNWTNVEKKNVLYCLFYLHLKSNYNILDVVTQILPFVPPTLYWEQQEITRWVKTVSEVGGQRMRNLPELSRFIISWLPWAKRCNFLSNFLDSSYFFQVGRNFTLVESGGELSMCSLLMKIKLWVSVQTPLLYWRVGAISFPMT